MRTESPQKIKKILLNDFLNVDVTVGRKMLYEGPGSPTLKFRTGLIFSGNAECRLVAHCFKSFPK